MKGMKGMKSMKSMKGTDNFEKRLKFSDKMW